MRRGETTGRPDRAVVVPSATRAVPQARRAAGRVKGSNVGDRWYRERIGQRTPRPGFEVLGRSGRH